MDREVRSLEDAVKLYDMVEVERLAKNASVKDTCQSHKIAVSAYYRSAKLAKTHQQTLRKEAEKNKVPAEVRAKAAETAAAVSAAVKEVVHGNEAQSTAVHTRVVPSPSSKGVQMYVLRGSVEEIAQFLERVLR